MAGHRIKLGKGQTIKDGKVVPRQYKLSPPAAYAKKTKRTYKAAAK